MSSFTNYYLNIYSLFIIVIFVIINISILWSDIGTRKIKNNALLLLIAILPFWYIIFPNGSYINIITQAIFSTILIIFGIFFYSENGFLGSGDIKYWAIMILFLGTHSLVHFIGNIGILTIIILFLWWSMILGQVYGLGYFQNGWNRMKQISAEFRIENISHKTFGSKIILLCLDWIVIGYLLMNLIKIVSVEIFQIIPVNGEFYFVLSICLFILRPQLRYILTKWQYRVFPMIGICIYFGLRIQEIGASLVLKDIYLFGQNIWIYILIFTLVQGITRWTFNTYDTIMKENAIKTKMNTIPYSVTIFLGFISVYFWDVNLVQLAREYFL